MQATFIGAQHKAGSFTDERTGRVVEYDNTQIFTVRPFRAGTEHVIGDKVSTDKVRGNWLDKLKGLAAGSVVSLSYDCDDYGKAILIDLKPVK